jgi:hypothetical protein
MLPRLNLPKIKSFFHDWVFHSTEWNNKAKVYKDQRSNINMADPTTPAAVNATTPPVATISPSNGDQAEMTALKAKLEQMEKEKVAMAAQIDELKKTLVPKKVENIANWKHTGLFIKNS